MVLIEMAYIKILKLYMILMILIEMAYIKILKLYMILMVLIFMIIEKNQVKLKLAKQNLLKIKKEKDMSIYLLLYLKYILIIVRKN